MSDDTPTQRFDTPLTPTTPPEPDEEKKSRGLLIALIVIGALLLIGIIVVLILLLGGKGTPTADATTTSASATASTTPSATPTPTPTPTPTKSATTAPAPPSNAPTISSFSAASSTVFCNKSAPTGDHQPIAFSWSSNNVSQVYFGVDTNDASTGFLFSGLPPTGNSNDDFPPGYDKGSYEYPCTAPSTVFTLTVVNSSGQKASKSVTIVNKGDK